MTDKQPYRGSNGHSSHVPSVKFSPGMSRPLPAASLRKRWVS
jgi:hypothetical protein